MAPAKTQFVRVTTDLPLSAEDAFALAHKLALFEYVVRPVIRLAVSDEQRAQAADPNGFSIGDQFAARLWFLMLIPVWTHRLKIVFDGTNAAGDLELYTNESSGPARIWNHRLTFRATGPAACSYTDEVEIERGPLGLPTALFIKVFFRYRQWRWRQLARVLA